MLSDIKSMCSFEHMICMNWVSDLYGFCYTNLCYELFIRILCPTGHRICILQFRFATFPFYIRIVTPNGSTILQQFVNKTEM